MRLLKNPTKIKKTHSLISDVHCFKKEYIHLPAGEEGDREELMDVRQPASPGGEGGRRESCDVSWRRGRERERESRGGQLKH